MGDGYVQAVEAMGAQAPALSGDGYVQATAAASNSWQAMVAQAPTLTQQAPSHQQPPVARSRVSSSRVRGSIAAPAGQAPGLKASEVAGPKVRLRFEAGRGSDVRVTDWSMGTCALEPCSLLAALPSPLRWP